MSIGLKIPENLPNTGQGFLSDKNFVKNISGCFIHKKDFVIPSEDQLTEDYFLNAMDNLELMPLHLIVDLEIDDDSPEYKQSKQYYTYRTQIGKYRHIISFDKSLEYQQILESYSGTDVNIIYYTDDRALILTKEGAGFRGFRTSRVDLEKPALFTNGTEDTYTRINVELYDTEEVTKNGVVKRVEWFPLYIDKLFITIKIEYLSSNALNFTAKHLQDNITTLKNTDVTITDNATGNVTFSLFNYNGGVYRLGGFDKNLTSGCLSINSNIHLGNKKYLLRIQIEFTNQFLFLDDDDFLFLDDDNFLLMTTLQQKAYFNAGGDKTSDWLKDANVPDIGNGQPPLGWRNLIESTLVKYVQVSGNGFEGIAQRVEKIQSGILFLTEIISISNESALSYEVGKKYEIKLKYRSSQDLSVFMFDINKQFFQVDTFSANTSNAIEVTTEFIATKERLFLGAGIGVAGAIGDYFELDQLYRIEEI